MTQVSRFKLRVDLEKRIYDLLSTTLAGIKDKGEINNFLDDFLSPTEKIVFAKRLAIAVLLAKKREYDEIRQILRVTPITISKMSLRMKYGNSSLKRITDKVVASDDNRALFQELLSMFDSPTKGLPKSEYYKKVNKREAVIRKLKTQL